MLCDNCKKNKATTYFKKTVNGETTETFLCEDCAKKLGIGAGMMFKNGGFADFDGFDFFLPDLFKPTRLGTEKKCECGRTFSEIAKTGLVGCEKCYETFKKELASTLRKMHGATTHKPRIEASKKADPQAEIKALRDRMSRAIKEENFEEAARLRDEIKAREEK
jgi:protein arginine kinase activator